MKVSGLPASLQDDLYLKDIKATNTTVTPVLNTIGICQGVLNVCSRHCTGNRAIALFKKEYGKNYIQTGVGKTLELIRQ